MFSSVKSLFGTAKGPTRPAPPDHDIIAIGDIHGRRDLLEALLEQLSTQSLSAETEFIFLGDYVDRGPDSASVIDCLLNHSLLQSRRCVFLKGNHEATLLNFLDDPEIGRDWVKYGGGETLLSYGVTQKDQTNIETDRWSELADQFRAALPQAHFEFFQSLEIWVERGCYFFVHAGINPDRPIHQQSESEYLWIRDIFLDDRTHFDRIIVHGHTPETEPVRDERRIGLDTGAYQTGKLTAAHISGPEVRFIST